MAKTYFLGMEEQYEKLDAKKISPEGGVQNQSQEVKETIDNYFEAKANWSRKSEEYLNIKNDPEYIIENTIRSPDWWKKQLTSILTFGLIVGFGRFAKYYEDK